MAIDLYVGDPALFVCDRSVKVSAPDEIDAVLRGMETDALRHVSLVPRTAAPWAEALALMRAVMTTLDGMTSHDRLKALGRVTFVLGDRPQYDAYQRALFATYPDES